MKSCAQSIKKREVKLHVFNPEHDIALAYDKPHIMVPHVAQELRMALGWLPAVWAEDGDCVLVDDIRFALKAVAPFGNIAADVLFVGREDLSSLPIDAVEPWGWDRRIRAELAEGGVDERLLPSDAQLADIRMLSGREHTTGMLERLRQGLENVTCGEAFRCVDMNEVEECIGRNPAVVVKAPWSSSGRGIRYVNVECDEAKRAWIQKMIEKQGYVMVEPRYNRMADFAAEFYAHDSGRVEFEGISVFHTQNGKYTGNVIADEEEKRFRLARYVDTDLLDVIIGRIEEIMPELLPGRYTGPFGVDMMAVADMPSGRLKLHPCVEINLRRTMGHVALSLAEKDFEFASMMSIRHKVNYQLCIERIEGKFVNVIYR